MKKSILFLLIVIGITAVSAQNGIRFEDESSSLDALLKKAKTENKIIFIDCYTTWCGPCKWMVKNVFPNDTIGTFYNQNFINASFDMENGEGTDIAKKYDVQCYPTFIFLSSDGKLLHRVSGAYPVKKFLEAGKEAIVPEKQYSFFNDKYEAGAISRIELISYMTLRQASCLGIQDEKDKFYSIKPEAQDSLNWFVMRNFGVELHSSEFNDLVSKRDSFYILYKKDAVDEVIVASFSDALGRMVYYSMEIDTVEYKDIISELKKLDLKSAGKVICETDLGFYTRTENWTGYAATSVEYVEKYVPKDEEEYMNLNNLAWPFYEHVEDAKYLEIAVGWAKRSVDLRQEYFNTDTYAALLYKVGKKAEAKAAAEKAIELAKKTEQDYTGTSELLEKIKAMK